MTIDPANLDPAELEALFVAAGLLETIEPVTPKPSVRQGLEERLASQESTPGFATADATAAPDPVSQDRNRMVILRGNEFDWQETGVTGVRSRNLFVDSESNRLTVLIQMDAGAHYPNHDHPGVEECMVIDGDLHIAGTVLHKFDYLRTPKGGDHGEPWTEGGCLLMVTIPLAA